MITQDYFYLLLRNYNSLTLKINVHNAEINIPCCIKLYAMYRQAALTTIFNKQCLTLIGF